MIGTDNNLAVRGLLVPDDDLRDAGRVPQIERSASHFDAGNPIEDGDADLQRGDLVVAQLGEFLDPALVQGGLGAAHGVDPGGERLVAALRGLDGCPHQPEVGDGRHSGIEQDHGQTSPASYPSEGMERYAANAKEKESSRATLSARLRMG